MIDLHYWPTPNGKKISILLEELEMPYRVVPCDISRGDQFQEAFLRISPNNRMPAIVDHAPADGGDPLGVFESGAIAIYLADKAGRFIPQDVRGRCEVIQWVMWQMANQGPKTGEAGHFGRLGDREGDQSYALTRFTNEVHRLFGVMNNRLYDRAYLAGDEVSIADFVSFPWAHSATQRRIDIGEFVYVGRWLRDLEARPALQRGMEVGVEEAEPTELTEEDKRRVRELLYSQRARPAPEGGLV